MIPVSPFRSGPGRSVSGGPPFGRARDGLRWTDEHKSAPPKRIAYGTRFGAQTPLATVGFLDGLTSVRKTVDWNKCVSPWRTVILLLSLNRKE